MTGPHFLGITSPVPAAFLSAFPDLAAVPFSPCVRQLFPEVRNARLCHASERCRIGHCSRGQGGGEQSVRMGTG